MTQYALGLDWLREIEVVTPDGRSLTAEAASLPHTEAAQLAFARSVRRSAPSWLQDADALITDPGDLPEDMTRLAIALEVQDVDAIALVQRLHGRVDVEERQRVGEAGEEALAALLERVWPGSVVRVSIEADTFGYDLRLEVGATWHLEVKTTTRRGRLAIHLSRHEYEVSQVDPTWQLVAVGLGPSGDVSALATIPKELITSRAPRDGYATVRWDSARYEILPTDLTAGLPFLVGFADGPLVLPILLRGYEGPRCEFSWLPTGDSGG